MDPEAQVDKGESARFSSFMGAIAIADLVKTTLGPKGMDKILQSVSNPNGDIMVTNDGATILRSIVVDNPAAKVLIDIAKTQDDEVGDGTTSVTVLAGELLREAEKLIQLRIHPMVIIDGWRKATAIARTALEASSLDHGADPVAFRADLMNIARTSELTNIPLLLSTSAKVSNSFIYPSSLFSSFPPFPMTFPFFSFS